MRERKFSDQNQGENNPQAQQKIRVKLPKGREILGIVEQRLGGNKMSVRCADGKERNCRIPGRLRRELWLRPGAIVIVEPWEFDENKADVLFKYNPASIQWLREKGYLKNLEE